MVFYFIRIGIVLVFIYFVRVGNLMVIYFVILGNVVVILFVILVVVILGSEV